MKRSICILYIFLNSVLCISYDWIEVNITKKKNCSKLLGVPANLVNDGKPVYVSLTTISFRIDVVYKTINAILNGTVIPDHVYLFISKESYILDKGIQIKSLPENLMEITACYPFSIIYTQNIGPHRKLLPLLSKKLREDCAIITMDDEYEKPIDNTIGKLIDLHKKSNRKSVAALTVRRIGFCNTLPWKLLTYRLWLRLDESHHEHSEMLILTIGTGGVLYRPKFFHSMVFNETLRLLTEKQDDLLFRLTCMMNNVKVIHGYENYDPKLITALNVTKFINTSSSQLDEHHTGLYESFNRNGGNIISIVKILNYLTQNRLFNFTALIDKYIYKDRRHCFTKQLVIKSIENECMFRMCNKTGNRNSRISHKNHH